VELEQTPLDNQYPSLQVKATVLDEQVAALVPQAEQTPDAKKCPVLQVRETNPPVHV